MENKKTPDILNCLANLSSDEVFTSPEMVNKMLDTLPQDLFSRKDTRFLDPCSKSGIFLREITKRLLEGLKDQIPDLQERVNWILKNQVFGIPLTELTYLMSKRTLYCSRLPSGKYSITTAFAKDDKQGNIRFKNFKHKFDSTGKCIYCGCNKDWIKNHVEQYAYQFIHAENPKEIFKNMKFDVIIGNPPYQLETTGAQAQAVPLYDKFIDTAIALNPHYVVMIVPSRWFTGGFGLNDFRNKMAKSKNFRELHDFLDASECFPGVEIKGGVNYFLWDRDYKGKCDFYTHSNGEVYKSTRYLESDFLPGMVIRDSKSIDIVKKILDNQLSKKRLTDIVGPQTPFGISTNDPAMHENKENDDIKIYALKKQLYIKDEKIQKNRSVIEKWKLFTPKAVGSGDTSTDCIKPLLGEPGSCCSGTYIYIGPFNSEIEAKNAASYISTKFFHFLVGQMKNTQDCLYKVYSLVPLLNFKEEWNDEKLYKLFDLNEQEKNYIEQLVWPSKGE